jgi:hypothetical protein
LSIPQGADAWPPPVSPANAREPETHGPDKVKRLYPIPNPPIPHHDWVTRFGLDKDPSKFEAQRAVDRCFKENRIVFMDAFFNHFKDNNPAAYSMEPPPWDPTSVACLMAKKLSDRYHCPLPDVYRRIGHLSLLKSQIKKYVKKQNDRPFGSGKAKKTQKKTTPKKKKKIQPRKRSQVNDEDEDEDGNEHIQCMR